MYNLRNSPLHYSKGYTTCTISHCTWMQIACDIISASKTQPKNSVSNPGRKIGTWHLFQLYIFQNPLQLELWQQSRIPQLDALMPDLKRGNMTKRLLQFWPLFLASKVLKVLCFFYIKMLLYSQSHVSREAIISSLLIVSIYLVLGLCYGTQVFLWQPFWDRGYSFPHGQVSSAVPEVILGQLNNSLSFQTIQ